MRLFSRPALSIMIAGLLALCFYFFMASYEPPGVPPLRPFLFFVGILLMIALVAVWLVKRPRG